MVECLKPRYEACIQIKAVKGMREYAPSENARNIWPVQPMVGTGSSDTSIDSKREGMQDDQREKVGSQHGMDSALICDCLGRADTSRA